MTVRAIAGHFLVTGGKILFGAAGLSLFVGGWVISQISAADRTSGELDGIVLATVCGLLGFALYSVGDRLQEVEQYGPMPQINSLNLNEHPGHEERERRE